LQHNPDNHERGNHRCCKTNPESSRPRRTRQARLPDPARRQHPRLLSGILQLNRGGRSRRLDEEIFVTVCVLNQRNGARWRNCGVANEMAHVQAKQRARYIRDDDLSIANRQHIMPT
jgi:hypothetical protein